TAPALLAGLLAATPPPAEAFHRVLGVASETAPVSPAVSALAQGVITTMNVSNAKLVALVAASIGVVALAGMGTVFALHRTPLPAIAQVEEPVNTAAPEPEKPIEGDWIPKNSDAPLSVFPELKRIEPDRKRVPFDKATTGKWMV